MSAPEIEAFRSYLPVRISFGDGVSGELAAILEGLGATSALVVIEEPVAGIGLGGGRSPWLHARSAASPRAARQAAR